MTNIFDVIREIKAHGYEAKTVVMDKNGVQKTGITFVDNNNISPIYYLDNRHGTAKEIALNLIDNYNGIETNNDIKEVVSLVNLWDKVWDKIYICLERAESGIDDYFIQKSEGNLRYVTKRFLDLQMFVRIILNNHMTVKVTNELLDSWNVTEDEVWKVAHSNTENILVCRQMGDVLGEMIYLEDTTMLTYPLVLTNKTNMYGAAYIVFKEKIREIAEKLGEDVYILPSSVHEVLLLPVSYVDDPVSLKQMVLEVNDNPFVMNPEDILSYSVYRYYLDVDILCMAM